MMHMELIKRESNFLLADINEENLLIGVAGKNCNTVNYTEPFGKNRKYEKFLLHFQTAAQPDRIFFLNQEHSDKIITIDKPTDPKIPFVDTADAMITNQKEYCLAIRTADCIPIFLSDSTHNCIAAIHSGWKSTEKNIVGQCVTALIDTYSASLAHMKAYILPGIAEESYEVSEDVAKKFPDCYTQSGEKYTLDLKKAVVLQLREAGLTKHQIFASYCDTYEHNNLFFSHRRGDKGRNINCIMQK